MSAKFITVEGTEGAGKSTNLEFICRYLGDINIAYCVTREPGGTPVAEKIREILLAEHSEPIEPLAELLLVFAARAQHIERVIQPALARGEWVVCD
ncbi:MAG: dTMP kinase, partial [Gammaproteobacteria bacterium]|nr:dTMP kinase [Gammaproteobacteria bacterium]